MFFIRICRIAILLVPIALGACAQYSPMTTSLAGPKTFAWDGAGQDPNRPPPLHKRTAPRVVAEQSGAGETGISADEADRDLASRLVICRGCIKPAETANRPEGSRVAYR